MPSDQDFHVSFRYRDETYRLEKRETDGPSVKINGITYAVLGKEEQLAEVCQLLQAAPLESVLSEKDLNKRLSSLEGVTLPPAGKAGNVSKRHLASKAKEAEDLPQPRPLLKRQASGRSARLSEIEKIQRSGEMWECKERMPDRHSNGNIYVFKLKDEYDYTKGNWAQKFKNIIEKQESIFPATEPIVSDMKSLQDDLRGEGCSRYLKDLGYDTIRSEDGLYFHLPDKEVLMARWELLRQKMPNLPKLDIASSEGVADDISFIETYFTHDALLSSGKEYLHDHFAHIIPILHIILESTGRLNAFPNSSAYAQERNRLVKLIIPAYRRIMIAKREIDEGIRRLSGDQLSEIEKNLCVIRASLSAIVDGLSNLSSLCAVENIDKREIESQLKSKLFQSEHWRGYFKRRFKIQDTDVKQLANLWVQIEEIEATFDRLRKKE